MKVLVVDDELLARKRIIKLLNALNDTITIYEASSGKEAIEVIDNVSPDLVFLDIQMTDMNGFDVVRKIKNDIPVLIFVTAHDMFAVKAFEVQAIDFLLKPYKKQRFISAFHRAMEIIELNRKDDFKDKINNLISYIHNNEVDLNTADKNYLDKVVLKLNNRYYFINVDDIKYIVSSAYYAEIYTFNNQKHVHRISMTSFNEKLPPSKFIRINRSTIVNHGEINEIVSEGKGDFSIVMNDDKAFQLTKNYKNDFFKLMQIKS